MLIQAADTSAMVQGSLFNVQWNTPLCANVEYRLVEYPDYDCSKYVRTACVQGQSRWQRIRLHCFADVFLVIAPDLLLQS